MSIDLNDVRAVLGEFFGTLIFLFSSTLAVTGSGGQITNIAMGFGLSLIVVIYLFGPVSGGHINPAVTFAIMISGNMHTIVGIAYMFAQMAGAVVGTAFAYAIIPGLKGGIYLQPGVSIAEGFLAEALGTWVLVMSVFCTAVQSTVGMQTKARENLRSQAPLIIGMSVWAMHLALVRITGCGINPARWFGTALVLHEWHTDAWVYLCAPLVGALMTIPVQYALFGGIQGQNVEETTKSSSNIA